MKFHGLTKEQKALAIANFRDINEFNPDMDYYKEILTEKGFKNPEIFYVGFRGQGDGASFTARINIDKIFTGKLSKYKRVYIELVHKGYILDLKIMQFGKYYHEKTMHIVSEDYTDNLKFPDLWFEEFNTIEAEILQKAKKVAMEIYKELKDEYDYQMSDEYIIETIEANDYSFDYNGEII